MNGLLRRKSHSKLWGTQPEPINGSPLERGDRRPGCVLRVDQILGANPTASRVGLDAYLKWVAEEVG